jgi:hypothetical protein
MLKGTWQWGGFSGFFCINWILIDPLHYLSSRFDFGSEFAKIFLIEKRLPDSASRVGESTRLPIDTICSNLQSQRLLESRNRRVVFRLRISPRIQSQNWNGSKCSVRVLRDQCQTDLCKNLGKSASLLCPFNLWFWNCLDADPDPFSVPARYPKTSPSELIDNVFPLLKVTVPEILCISFFSSLIDISIITI